MNEYTLNETEAHPAAYFAMNVIQHHKLNNPHSWAKFKESIYSTALSGNRLSQICVSTLDRLEKGEPVSDRYLLGLAWVVRDNLDM